MLFLAASILLAFGILLPATPAIVVTLRLAEEIIYLDQVDTNYDCTATGN